MPDPFRSKYRQLTPEEQAHVDRLKWKAAALYQELDPPTGAPINSDQGRALALARTKLEECVMWATKGITG